MYGKLLIGCDLVVRTGMHIGGSSAFSAIGAVDSPVVKDPYSRRPIVPGSSLKGKLRTLLARSYAADIEKLPECNGDKETLLRLFGSSAEPIHRARLQFADAFLSNKKQLEDAEVPMTEVKFENFIDRRTSVANPRQIERVVPGAVFAQRIVYEVVNLAEVEEDLTTLAKALRLLQMDYLGGHGTRGSGRVSFRKFQLEAVGAALDTAPLKKLFQDVEDYELLPV